MKYDFIEQRDQLVKQRLLRCDDLDDLRIYVYHNQCKTWNDLTLNSRGIIFNRKTGEVVAQPFAKFFNMNKRIETQERNLPWRNGFRIFRKEDGWLGTLYRVNEEYKIATRGSFTSPGAVWATKYLRRYDLTGLPDEVTLMFEIICPITHIVVDYGKREDLVLLAAYNRKTGEEYDWEQARKWSQEFGFTLVESYTQDWLGYCRGQIKTIPGNQLEGFVIRFNNGLRIKIKSEDYFRRSYLLHYLTPLAVWTMMVNGKVPEEVWEWIDIDYHNKLDEIASVLEKQYSEFNESINLQFAEVEDIGSYAGRSEFAKAVCKMGHQHALFALLDGHYERVDEYIHKLIRPHKNIIKGE